MPAAPVNLGNAAANLAARGGAQGGEINAIMNDPNLTVEDKVTQLLSKVMKQMDKQIEEQGNKINALQNQGGQGGQGGAGGAGGAAGGAGGQGGQGGGNPSVDVETMKLKRAIDKRSQMFDTFRQIIDKYNETAKNQIQSMSR